jgi:hypothetical protein
MLSVLLSGESTCALIRRGTTESETIKMRTSEHFIVEIAFPSKGYVKGLSALQLIWGQPPPAVRRAKLDGRLLNRSWASQHQFRFFYDFLLGDTISAQCPD